MFDFFCIYDFKKRDRHKLNSISFSKLKFYDEVNKIEKDVCLKNGLIKYLERKEPSENYFTYGALHVFLFGTVYTNKKYFSDTQIMPKKLGAENIYSLYMMHNFNIVEFIKGSFVIVIINDNEDKIYCITDRLNVLPLYYYYKNGLLVISSAIKLMFKVNGIKPDVDEIALTEQLLFDYTLGDRTFFKEIKRMNNGTIYSFDANSLKITKYWGIEELYHEKLLPKKDSLELLSNQLYENVQLYTSDVKKILISLTGGFDGRTNLAMLKKDKEDFLCYSYGMPGSKQIQVPMEIAKTFKVNYTPIYLSKDFENSYINLGRKVIEFSNGQSPFTHANLAYAFSMLNKFSDVVLTGLFGSEVLRPIHNLGIFFNDYSEKIFVGPDYKKAIDDSYAVLAKLRYLNEKIILDNKDYVGEFFKRNYFEKYKGYDKKIIFFFFILEEGVRKYFTQEIQTERVFVSNRYPYWDDDFIDLLFRTTFAGMYNGFLGKSKYKRRKGQLLYAQIFKMYNRELGKIKLDRGYAPNDLLLPFPINYLKIGIAVHKTKKYYKKVGNDTFNTEYWARLFYDYSKSRLKHNEIFDKGMVEFNNFDDSNKLLKYAHLLSINNFFYND